MPVRYWTTPNDENYSNTHAECQGIEFFAFPHQGYSARVYEVYGRVSNNSPYLDGWSVNVGWCLPNGQDYHVIHGFFSTKDEAFECAARDMLDLINSRITE